MPIFKRLLFAVLLVFSVVLTQSADAAIIWDYSTTDGVNTISGMLTTDGDSPQDQTPGSVFNVLQIDNAFLNGTLITDWVDNIVPPFGIPNGSIEVITPGNGIVDVDDSNSVQDLGSNFSNLIILAAPNTVAMSGIDGAIINNNPMTLFFSPTSTTFTTGTAIPTPSAMLLMGTGLLGLIGWRNWRTRND